MRTALDRRSSRQSLAGLRTAVEAAWSAATSSDPEEWTPANPAWGQCAVTALVVQDVMGGRLLRTEVDGVSHYWNELPGGREVDFTKIQFGPDAVVRLGEPRERSYVLSFPATRRRYGELRRRVRRSLALVA